jgi:CBS domain-containing protein
MAENRSGSPAPAPQSRGLPEFFFLSELLHDRVIQQPGRVIGALADAEIRLEGRYPEVTNLVVARPFGRLPLIVPMSMVQSVDARKTIVDVPPDVRLSEYRQEPERVLVKDMILDKRIIDTDEYEVEVVYDIHLLYTERRLFVVHVDVSRAGMLRRLRLGWLARLLYGDLKHMKLLPWRYVQSLPSDIGRFKGDVKLNVSREKIADIHPADLADILEELSGEERMSVFDTLDTETAADTLEETEPRVQRQLIAAVRRERVVELLNTMTPAQIADILEILPRVEADALLGTLPAETAAKVGALLSEHEVSLVSIATNHYLAMSAKASVAEALDRFRDRSKRYDVIMYVYVVDPEGLLKGVVDIRELIQARPEATLGSIMTGQVVTLAPSDSLADAAREFAKYGFRSLPMVDEKGKLTGAVRHKDLLAAEQ